MTGTPATLRDASRLGLLVGSTLCVGTPAVLGGLIVAGLLPAGSQRPEGPYLQLGHLFTGLVLLATAWVLWRRGAVLRAFAGMAEARRPGVVLRESLLYAALFELSSLCGMVYWLLVGQHAARHVAGFILLSPLLFLAFVPRLRHWTDALGQKP